MLGILGPSGSGKTTLLSTLAGLVGPGLHWRVGGCVALDGRRVAAARHLAALVGHVPQHDLLARSLTVAECVAASAVLRMSSGEVAMGRRHMEVRLGRGGLGVCRLSLWGLGPAPTGGGNTPAAAWLLRRTQRARLQCELPVLLTFANPWQHAIAIRRLASRRCLRSWAYSTWPPASSGTAEAA